MDINSPGLTENVCKLCDLLSQFCYSHGAGIQLLKNVNVSDVQIVHPQNSRNWPCFPQGDNQKVFILLNFMDIMKYMYTWLPDVVLCSLIHITYKSVDFLQWLLWVISINMWLTSRIGRYRCFLLSLVMLGPWGWRAGRKVLALFWTTGSVKESNLSFLAKLISFPAMWPEYAVHLQTSEILPSILVFLKIINSIFCHKSVQILHFFLSQFLQLSFSRICPFHLGYLIC